MMHKFSNQFLDDLDAALDRRRDERRAIRDADRKRHRRHPGLSAQELAEMYGSSLASTAAPAKGRWDDEKMVRDYINARKEELGRYRALQDAHNDMVREVLSVLSQVCEECRSSFAEAEESAQAANILKFREALLDAHRKLKPDDLARMYAEIASDREGADQ
jgi:hypothetical protein